MRFPVIFIVFLFLSCRGNNREKETHMNENWNEFDNIPFTDRGTGHII